MPATLALGRLLVQLRSKRALTTGDRVRARRDLVAAMNGQEQPVDRAMAEAILHNVLAELSDMGFSNADLVEMFNAGALDRTGPVGVRHG
ncbi:hypothetical protein [Nitrospirillum amazonense]|uniref:hypothetical protein n=1 Tax=Nitrospirillum amazonense TaxID=28077 RepID=UPI0024122E00|nr:hypothetical protein [Nitrospirillum amazonense]MDG3442422.1 hypothetical protein [Nitrospirillum amazonense]